MTHAVCKEGKARAGRQPVVFNPYICICINKYEQAPSLFGRTCFSKGQLPVSNGMQVQGPVNRGAYIVFITKC